jgi:hypothetical protein
MRRACKVRFVPSHMMVTLSEAAQQQLLQEQAASLAHFRALPESTQSHSLQFITRDTAAEESKGMAERMKKLEQTLKDKNSRISELEDRSWYSCIFSLVPLVICLVHHR